MKLKDQLFDLEPIFLKDDEDGNIDLIFINSDGFTEFKATVWVAGLKAGELAIKDYSENEGMLEALIYHGYIKPPHRYIRSGYVDIPICKLTDYARQYMEEQWNHDDN